MTRKCPPEDFENAIKAYVAGESSQNAAARFGTAEARLSKELKRRGLFRSKAESRRLASEKMAATRVADYGPSPDEVADLYKAGLSENALAEKFSVSRTAIRTRLRHAGVRIRSIAEANRLRASRTPRREHLRRIRIAQRSNRGRPHTLNHRMNIAKTRERNLTYVSDYERDLAGMLAARGLRPALQKAVGPYNVDLAIHPIAVEVFGGAWHARKKHHAKRARYILDSGWNLVFVWSQPHRIVIEVGAADYIVSFLEELRRNPTPARQYRVIRGDGKLLATGSSDDDDLTIVASGYQSVS